jgi:hypothetical protein
VSSDEPEDCRPLATIYRFFPYGQYGWWEGETYHGGPDFCGSVEVVTDGMGNEWTSIDWTDCCPVGFRAVGMLDYYTVICLEER